MSGPREPGQARNQYSPSDHASYRQEPLQLSRMQLRGLRAESRKMKCDRDVYEAYQGLYQLWCSHNSAVQELRPLFQMPGIEPNGRLSITEDFRRQVAGD
jgi:hypothetical protein